MKIKFLPLTAILAMSISACGTPKYTIEANADEVLSENAELRAETDVNNDLLGENSVENVENPTESPEPAVENSPDSDTSEEKSDKNHAFVNDSQAPDVENSIISDLDSAESEKLSTDDTEKVENIEANEIFYVDGVPHIQKYLPSHPPFLTCGDAKDIGEVYADTEIVVVGRVKAFHGDRYFAAYSKPDIDSKVAYLSDMIPVEIEIIQVLKDENLTVSGLDTFEFYHSSGELTLEQYKNFVSPDFSIELYPENTVIECRTSTGNQLNFGDICLFFINSDTTGSDIIYYGSVKEYCLLGELLNLE